MDQNEITSPTCCICAKTINLSESPIFDDTLSELLDVIFTIDEMNKLKNISNPKMCEICLEKIHEIFDFKSRCINIEDILTPYINIANSELDLKEIGVKENMFAEMEISDIDTVCRLCINPISTNKIDLNSVMKDHRLQHLLENNLSEVNIHLIMKSYICDACFICLKKYSDFIEVSVARESNSQNQNFIRSSDKSLDNNKDNVKTKECVKDKNKVRCEKCSYETTYQSKLRNHMLSHKTINEVVLFKCKECPFKTKYRRSLQCHINSVHCYNPVKCTECNKQLKTKMNLKKHMLCHSSTKTFSCEQCEYKTKYKDGLRHHVLIHKNENECTWFSCDKCTYKSKFRHKLKRHFLLHEDKPPRYDCSSCDYKTNYKENLKKHMTKHNDNSEMFSCDQCSYKTKHKGYLKYHKAIHADPDKVIKYKCSICSYETIHKGNLIKQHMKSHKEVPAEIYKCEECDYETLYKSNIINHRKGHVETKPLRCTFCEFETKYKSSLSKHIKNHQGS